MKPSVIPIPALLALVALGAPAHAQDGSYDGHGPMAPPLAGGLSDPMFRVPAGGWPGGFGLNTEFVKRPVVRTITDSETGAALGELAELDNVLATHLGGAYRFGRVAVGLQGTLYPLVTSDTVDDGLALGDVYLWVPVDILRPGDDGGLALSVVPVLGLPTATSPVLGNNGPLFGARVASDYLTGPLRVGANVGFDHTGGIDEDGWSAGTLVRAAGSAGYEVVSDSLGVGLEARMSWDGGSTLPAEVLGTGRIRVADPLMLSFGAGTAVSTGVGAPLFRGFVGFAWAMPPDEPVIEPEEPIEPEVVEVLAETLRVTDPDGHVVRGADVSIGETEVGTTDHDGRVTLPQPIPEGLLRVMSTGFDALELEHVPKGSSEAVVPLVWTPVELLLRITAPDGSTPDAEIKLTGPAEAPEAQVDDVGTRRFELQPGTWTLVVEADGFGKQTRTIVAEAGQREELRVDAVLTEAAESGATVAIDVTSPDGEPVADASVQLGDALLGTAGSGGRLVVSDVAKGDLDVRVQSPSHPDAVTRMVEIADQTNDVGIELGWAPGSVKVLATGPDGEPVDGLVAFAGPATLAPAQLGTDGSRVFTLRPGRWTVLVSSPTLGVQQRHIEIEEDNADLKVVQFVLQADEGGEADLFVQVVDPDGQPVSGAELKLDGLLLGSTASSGAAELYGLDAGERNIVVSHPDFRPAEVELGLVAGRQRVGAVLGWQAGSVRVYALGPKGQPVDALVALSSEGKTPAPVELGQDGKHLFHLDPGEWQLVATSPEFGVQTRSFGVPEDYDRLVAIGLGMYPPSPEGGALTVSVSGPRGKAVEGAEVWLDGFPIGTAPDGTLKAEAVGLGEHEIRARAPGLMDGIATVKVPDRDAVVPAAVELDWGVGALLVNVQGPDELVRSSLIGVSGSQPIAPAAPDADGTRVFQLEPGPWFVLVSSPFIGPEQQVVEIPEAAGLTEVSFDLGAEPADTGVVLLWVQDGDGLPVGGVGVEVGGEQLGKTSPAGVQLLRGLQPGSTTVRLDPPYGMTAQELTFDVLSGSQERFATLEFDLVPLAVKVVGPEGEPVDATVFVDGPVDVDELQTGSDGELTVKLRPGEWKVFARAEGFGVQDTKVTVVADGQHEVTLELSDPEKASVTAVAVEINERVQFDLDSANLRGESQALLDQVARLIQSDSSIVRIEIQGHTDDTGDGAYNQGLSERRAQAVREALIERGVAPEVLSARGYGMLRPLSPSQDDESRAANRRVEFVISERGE